MIETLWVLIVCLRRAGVEEGLVGGHYEGTSVEQGSPIFECGSVE